MKYAHIVQFVKDNHISWDTDIFDILKDFTARSLPPVENKGMDQDSVTKQPCASKNPSMSPIHSSLLEVKGDYQIPPGGEYSFEDVIRLFDS